LTREAAFFDLDRTLMAGSSAMSFARAAYRSGMVSRRQMARDAGAHLRFRLRGSTDETTEKVLARVTKQLAGVRESDIARLAPDVLAGVLPKIWGPMLAEVHSHQDAGRLTFIVSAAGGGMVALLAEVLGMDGGIGTMYEVGPDGTFTGRLEGPFVYGEGKVEAMQRVAGEHDIDMAQSYAYSDSASDLPMLRAVGNPVVVNPDAELTGIAKAEGWRIMRFEKLGRRLAIAGGTVVAALGGTALASRRAAQSRPARAWRR
jgi:HAD superfamily hydrolase (TIGR01490 family)